MRTIFIIMVALVIGSFEAFACNGSEHQGAWTTPADVKITPATPVATTTTIINGKKVR